MLKKNELCKRIFSVNRRGFTMMEILVAVMILAILVTMSVPMYERSVEKSRLAEVSTVLKRLSESKLRTMDSMDLMQYVPGIFTMKQLDVTIPESEDFLYSLYPASYPDAVCAKRLRGDNAGTLFLYLGETADAKCQCQKVNYPSFTKSVCGEYCKSGRKLFCQNAAGTTSCDSYGLDSYNVGSCS